MRVRKLIFNLFYSASFVFLILLVFSSFAQAQSINQNFPTPITSGEISGMIPARDIGDARLTSYFYVFNATQGDVFINVVTSNLNGDIDVFTADNLRPLAKITLYADASDSETGRVIYLRQPAKLILRIEGRTPNDNAAKFRIKFAGSFVLAESAENEIVEMPVVKTENQTNVRVNSVGTIVEIKPKLTPKPKEAAIETKPVKDREIDALENLAEKSPKKENARSDEKDQPNNIQNKNKRDTDIADQISTQKKNDVQRRSKKDAPAENTQPVPESGTNKIIAGREINKKSDLKVVEKPKIVKSVPPAALENIRLIILFKDGTRIERPMSEVLKFGIDKGVLTVVLKDGTIGRYSLLDVEKTTIE